MAIDNAALARQTAQYTALTRTTDPVSGLTDVVYCGLRSTLSSILSGVTGRIDSVAVFADTLELDVATVPAQGLVVMARELTGSCLGQPLQLAPPAGAQAVAQFLAGAAVGGAFTLVIAGAPDTPVAPPLGMTAPLSAASLLWTGSGSLAPVAAPGPAAVANLVSRSWALNALKCSFTAAAILAEGDAAERVEAQRMLGWVTACVASLAGPDLQIPSDYAELYNQGSALLVTLNVAPGAVYVPVLSSSMYSQQIGRLLNALRDYESQSAGTRRPGKTSPRPSPRVSASMEATAGIEITPLQVQLDNICSNMQATFATIGDLRVRFQQQQAVAKTAFDVLGTTIALGDIKKKLEAELELAMNVIGLGFDAVKVSEGDADGLRQASKTRVDGMRNLAGLIDAAGGSDRGDDLGQGATRCSRAHTLMATVLNGRVLWQQAQANQAGAVLPGALAAAVVDPVTDWDNYLAAVNAEVSILERDLDGDTASQDQADRYLASLQVLVGYGKAISGCYVAYAALLVQATVITAQIRAAQDVEARWNDTAGHATSDAEKLAALKALIQFRSDAIKRSIYVAWTYYAASYFYLNFVDPPHLLDVSMDAAALEDALSGVADWVARAIGDAPDGKPVRLPNTGVSITLAFDILQADGQSGGGASAALAAHMPDGSWQLSWVVPPDTPQWQGVLPNDGACAVWIQEAGFFIDGATPNRKGNVIAKVSTSGAYQNGFGSGSQHVFVTKPLSGDYAYHAADRTVYSAWSIDTAVYMTPTPYTQWTLTVPPGDADLSKAQRLEIALKVAYLAP